MRQSLTTRANDLSKKVPQNKKYANVTSTIDTGAKIKENQAPTANAVAKRRNEIYRRAKLSTLARLIKENEVSESIFAIAEDSADAMSAVGAPTRTAPSVSHAPTSVSYAGSAVLSVIESDIGMMENPDFILFDLRDEDAFAKSHIATAISYPATNIARDKFPPELYRMKSQKDKVCIIYHEDDRACDQFATQLVQKGWDNIHMLSGGISEARESYPEIIEGDLPMPLSPDRPKTGATSVSAVSRSSGRAR
jgi:centrosomal protein CEP41